MGLEMRPLLTWSNAWAYPFYGAIGGSFGYWLQGVAERQDKVLDDRKRRLLEKRQRRAEREAKEISEAVGVPVEEVPEGGNGKKDGFVMGGR